MARERRGGVGPLGHGVTLVELLVVISIIMILTVAVLPTMKPAAESRRIREAARAVNVFLSTARNRAIATSKPCGVIFERTEVDGRFCTVLYQAETPPPYAGDFVDSRMYLGNETAWLSKQFKISPNATIDPPPGMIMAGDELQLNYQGYRWIISRRSGSQLSFDSAGRPFPPFAPLYATLPFQVFRQPLKTAAEPLQLPAGVVVDLQYSGTYTAPSLFRKPDDPDDPGDEYKVIKTVKVVFAADGSLGRCFWGTDASFAIRYGTPTEPLHLLIGLIDHPAAPDSTPANGEAPPEDEWPNWIVPTNRWISISPQTGLIATSENHYVDPTQGANGLDWGTPGTWGPFINEARTYSREMQSMGGR